MIALARRVQRKVTSMKGTLLVVALAPEGIYLREYRRRVGALLPYDHAYTRAVLLAADATRVKAKRKTVKRGKLK